MITFLTLGGGEEIGANSYYLYIDGTGIILDAGMHPTKVGLESLPDYSLIANQPVDYIIISHAHQDHLASLPYAIKNFPYAKIIMTPQTLDIARLTLHNSVSILKEQMRHDKTFIIYDHDEIDMMLRMVIDVPYDTPFDLTGFSHKGDDGVTGMLTDAGHILGSACISIISKDKTIFYTGDISLQTQSTLKKAKLPEYKIDTIITETTYGSTPETDLHPLKEESLNLAKAANKIIGQGGSILIPVFALGKTQELLSIVWKLMESRKLAHVPIYTGGLSRKITKLYDKNRFITGANNPDLELVKIPQETLLRSIKPREVFKEPSIVLASSGMMMQGTASYRLAKHFLKDNNSAIFIVGYTEETTAAFRVANAKKGKTVSLHEHGEEIPVRCTIKKFRFTAHARRKDLVAMVKELSPEQVILLHGEEDSINWMGSSLLSLKQGIKVFVGSRGKTIGINRSESSDQNRGQ